MAEVDFSAADHEGMTRALRLAVRGLTTTTPNPRVGCVLVRDGVVVGEGWHQRAGEAHAEVVALDAAGLRARGATAYVTLEPCAHHGRTPPCADALVAAGVARIVAAMVDPNPAVAGRGLQQLAAAGIVTACGLMADAAMELNPGFVSRMTRGRPWVRLKTAISLDGRSALNDGRSQWITGEAARRDGHRYRARACAVLTGIGTVLADDPRLTVREVPCQRQPLRVVVDSQLRMPPSARLFDGAPLLIATLREGNTQAAQALRAAGAEILTLPASEAHVDLHALLVALAARGVNEVHVEAGAVLGGALARQALVDEYLVYQAASWLGEGAPGLTLPGSLAPERRLQVIDQRRVGEDWRWLLRPA